MMRVLWSLLVMSAATLARAAGGHAQGADGGNAVFKEGVGLTLAAETRDALGLTLADVDEGELASETRVTAQVYRTTREAPGNDLERPGHAYASAMLPAATARALAPDVPVLLADGATGRVVSVAHTLEAISGVCELLIAIPDPEGRLAIGVFVDGRLAGAATTVVRVPRTAVLEAAGGTFVYVQNGAALMRTPVTTGARDAAHVEITDGLYAGDVVAATAVEALHLTELRATKGGAHCH